jgi:hypothetical protein
MGHWENARNFRRNIRVLRERRRRLLTRTERVLFWAFAMAPTALTFGAVILMIKGGSKAIGIPLLLLGLLLMAMPGGLILQAKVRRRESRARRD